MNWYLLSVLVQFVIVEIFIIYYIRKEADNVKDLDKKEKDKLITERKELFSFFVQINIANVVASVLTQMLFYVEVSGTFGPETLNFLTFNVWAFIGLPLAILTIYILYKIKKSIYDNIILRGK